MGTEPEVIGRQCCRPLDEMEKAAMDLLKDEQCLLMGNPALVSFLCDAVRLCRQQEDGLVMAKGSNGVHRKCPKCGAHPVQFYYHVNASACFTVWGCTERYEGEHLHFKCSCGYQWREDPLDKQLMDKIAKASPIIT